MPGWPIARRCVGTATVILLAALAVACSTDKIDSTPPTIPAASPAAAPPTARPAAGAVRPLTGNPQAAVVDPTTAALVVLSAGTDVSAAASVTVFGSDGAARVIGLSGPATALAGGESDADARVYLSTRGGYYVVDINTGAVTRIDVLDEDDTDFTAIARRADGEMVLGSADGAVFLLREARDGAAAVQQRVDIFARVDSIVTQGNTAVVLDRGQTSVTSVDSDGKVQQALRAGEGATTMAADSEGRVLVADTRGDALLVFTVDPLIMRQRYPVPSAPYGLAGSDRLAWVSQTAANTVVGYDLATGIPVEKVRYPTVQQPNIVSFDADSDTLYVVSGSGDGVQVIEHATGPR